MISILSIAKKYLNLAKSNVFLGAMMVLTFVLGFVPLVIGITRSYLSTT